MVSLALAVALAVQHAGGAYSFRAAGPEESPFATAPAPVSPIRRGHADNPYQFLTWLNGTRGIYGLGPLVYDRELERWAAANNRAQRATAVTGHHVFGPARGQNAACVTGPISPYIGEIWMRSDEHRPLLLNPGITRCGLHWDGIYWTLNVR